MNAPEQPETVAERLQALGCDPIAGMAKLTQDESLPAMLRARMFAELATYVAPRRKATDLTGADGKPLDAEFRFNWDALSKEELETLQDLLLKVGT